MNIINVIPLSRGILSQQLSYFSSSEISLGSLVEVPVRKRFIKALVVEIIPASELKSKLRSADFALKKLGEVKAQRFLSESFIRAAKKTADQQAVSVGSVVMSLLPKVIIDEYSLVSTPEEDEKPVEPKAKPKSISKKKDGLNTELMVFQADDEERFATYKSIIREAFARKTSVFFCLPTIADIEFANKTLERGISAYTYILHSSLSKKQVLERWDKILKEVHPVLVIATPSFLGLPREDIGTVILDKENSSSYKMFVRPFLDYRIFAKKYAYESKIKVIFGDMFLRTETIFKAQSGAYEELAPLKFRALSTAKQEIVDMRKSLDENSIVPEKPKYTIFSDKLKSLIEKSHNDSEQLFLYTSRQGLNPITVCGDCGSVVTCKFCSAPISLHIKSKLSSVVSGAKKMDETNIFMCHKCGSRRSALEVCKTCGSWRLVPLGVGSELAEQQVKEMYPKIPVFRIDAQTATTFKKGVEIMDKFLATPGAILVGTEKTLSFLNKPINNVAIISIDSMFALPDFRINERIFSLILRLHVKATRNFLIQTRNSAEKIFEFVTKGNLLDFFRYELEERKSLAYPPYKLFIKISLEGNKMDVISQMEGLKHELKGYEFLTFPAFIPIIKAKYRIHTLIKLEADKWVDEKLLALLISLPRQFIVDVDPENLL